MEVHFFTKKVAADTGLSQCCVQLRECSTKGMGFCKGI